jgi:hypothetical protein
VALAGWKTYSERLAVDWGRESARVAVTAAGRGVDNNADVLIADVLIWKDHRWPM